MRRKTKQILFFTAIALVVSSIIGAKKCKTKTDPFRSVEDIKQRYLATKMDEETELAADDMFAEGAMTAINYENEEQAIEGK
ncbi:hypothetical protein ACYRFS_04545 [Listeria kieliensis]